MPFDIFYYQLESQKQVICNGISLYGSGIFPIVLLKALTLFELSEVNDPSKV
jgi:hypothetical protein